MSAKDVYLGLGVLIEGAGMQHPAKGPGQGEGGGGGCCSLPAEQSSCLERNCFALPFTKGNARGANSAARCHMDTKCSPLALRGGLLSSRLP